MTIPNATSLKLEYLNSNRADITPDQFGQMDQLFLSGQSAPLIAYAQQAMSKAEEKHHEYICQKIYEIAFEYAIEKDAHVFIADMLTHGEFIGQINHSLLLKYARTRNDKAFERRAITAMASAPSKFCSSDAFDIVDKFNRIAAKFFLHRARQAVSGNGQSAEQDARDDELMIRASLTDLNPSVRTKQIFLQSWVVSFLDALTDVENQQNMINDFFSYLPTDQESLTLVLITLASRHYAGKPGNPIAVNLAIDQFLTRFPFTSEQMVDAFDQLTNWDHLQLTTFEKLLKHVNPKHAKYVAYRSVLQCMSLAADKRPAFILQHPALLDPEATSDPCHWQLISSLNVEGRLVFLEKYIEDASFGVGSHFCSYIADYPEDTVTRYLEATHTKLGKNLLSDLVQKHAKCADLICTLLRRPDYRMQLQDLIQQLFRLFENNNLEAIDLLLSHPSAFLLLTKYYEQDGDGALPNASRGTLMPSVLAWFIAKKLTDKFMTLYAAIPDSERKKFLERCVYACIDARCLTIRTYIFQAGIHDLIDLAHPRFMRSSEPSSANSSMNSQRRFTVFVPKRFNNPNVIRSLRNYTQSIVQQFAGRRGREFELTMTSENTQVLARLVADNCAVTTLTFQHQTALKHTDNILMDGRLKSRLHKQGDFTTGKASDGFTNPQLQLREPNNVFSYFTRAPQMDNEFATPVYSAPHLQHADSRFIFDARQLLVEHPHVGFILLGLYPFFLPKTLQLPHGYTLSSDSAMVSRQTKIEVRISADPEETLRCIHQKMFELIMITYVEPLPEPTRSATIAILTHPQSAEDHALMRAFLDFIPLEWMVPGDVELKLSFVKTLEYGEKVFDLATIRQTARIAAEAEVLAAIKAIAGIEQLPFVVKGLLCIALKRRQKAVVSHLLQLKINVKNHTEMVFVPTVAHHIEAVAQLFLEDLNERVYVHYTENAISIECKLDVHSNRASARHAEMAKLQYALGMKVDVEHALKANLNEKLTIPFGPNAPFASLESILDAMLTYEVTTVLTSQQNVTYYQTHQGKFHPQTGKGANSGVVGLMKDRLFVDGVPYHVTVSCHADGNHVYVQTNNRETTQQIATTLQQTLSISHQAVQIDQNRIILELSVSDFIAKLRQRAIFYEGINVITEDGRLLLANRLHRGLASAGGHHSDKYHPKGIAYGLASEFGLAFREPKEIEQKVKHIHTMQSFSKTGIFAVAMDALVPTEAARLYAKDKHMEVAFKADEEEFVPGSEVSLTLTEMRGKQFYDVMPLAELCHYQLDCFKDYLRVNFPEAFKAMSVQINTQIQMVSDAKVRFKVPSSNFGKLTLTINGQIPEALRQVFDEKKLTFSMTANAQSVYAFDQSPFALLRAIRQTVQHQTQ